MVNFTPQEIAETERAMRSSKINLARVLMFASAYRKLTDVEIELRVNLALDPEVRAYMAVAATSLQEGNGWPPL